MALLSWLRSGHQPDLVDETSSPDTCKDPPKMETDISLQPEMFQSQEMHVDDATEELTFHEIAEQLEFYCEKAHAEYHRYENAVEKLKKTQEDKAALEQVIRQLQSENENLRNTITHQRTELSKLQAIPLKTYKAQISSLNAQVQLLKNRNTGEQNEFNELQANASKMRQRLLDLQFDVEFLRCQQDGWKPREKVPEMQLTPQSFVAVLVDGDAYGWAHDIFSNATIKSPGALAATRLSNEVTKYILEKGIPASKVIARVYINDTGMQTHNSKQTSFKKHQKRLLASFRVQFTEAIPLFDFVDVGHGKERADEKIRENFHLYLSNPCCQHIFLATCTDNGFARMLEPYQYHTSAHAKITLIPPGYVEREIAKLNFREVTWPSVFAKREAMNLPLKEEVKRLAVERARAEVVAHNAKMGFVGTVDLRVAGLVKDCVRFMWDEKTELERGMGRGRRQVGALGLRMLFAPRVEAMGGEMGGWDGGVD